jgi:hypothetical protein
MRALPARILNGAEVTKIAIAALKTSGCDSCDTKLLIPTNFHIRNRGLYNTLVIGHTG